VALAVQVVLAARADQEALAELAVPVVQEAPAGLVAQVVLAVLVVPAAAKLEHARVEAGLELVPAAEPAVNPVEAQVLVQVAAPARIKSAIAAHPHGQVRVPKLVEDLAVEVVETTQGQAAAEAATAWEEAE